MNVITGHGVLQHHFWGEYYATVTIKFASIAHARDAVSAMNKALSKSAGRWRHAKLKAGGLSQYAQWHGNSKKLDMVIEQLVGYGAERKKITSVATSIDYGENFAIRVPVTPREQRSLPGIRANPAPWARVFG